MPNLAITPKSRRFKLLQIAESGHGKSTRSLTATRFGKVYVFDLDDKLVNLGANLPDEQKKLVDMDVLQTYDTVLSKVKELVAKCEYATVVLDTWSRFYDIAIDKHFAGKTKLDFDDWALLKKIQREFIGLFFQIDANIIVNTHVGKKLNSEDKFVLTVGTSGSFGETLPERFNETHYLFVDDMNKSYKVRGTRSSRIVANTALPASTMDDKGCFKINDLSIFDGVALKR